MFLSKLFLKASGQRVAITGITTVMVTFFF